MADRQDRKHYVKAPEGRELTKADALQMGYALFDQIARDQAKRAREQDPDQEE